MNTTHKLLLTILTPLALNALTSCSSTPASSGVSETDFTLSGGYTNPETKESYTGAATTAIKYAPASPNVPAGTTAAAASSTSTAASPSQPATQQTQP